MISLLLYFNDKSALFCSWGRNEALIFSGHSFLFSSKITEAVLELVCDLSKKTNRKIEKTVERNKIKWMSYQIKNER